MTTRKVRLLAYVAIASLIVGIAYAIEVQSNSQAQRSLEAGLIESGNNPLLYFDLKNTGPDSSVYTYLVSYNSTATRTSNYTSSLTIPPGDTFSYSQALTRPSSGLMIVQLVIYSGSQPVSEDILYQQQWTVRASV